MELKLKRKNIKEFTIEGNEFKIDCNNVSIIQAFDEFTAKQRELTAITHETVVEDCKTLLDIAIPELWETLFGDGENSLAPYYLCLDLRKEVMGELLKDLRADQKKEEKEALQSINNFASSMNQLTNAMDKADRKYGCQNAMVNQVRASKKRSNR